MTSLMVAGEPPGEASNPARSVGYNPVWVVRKGVLLRDSGVRDSLPSCQSSAGVAVCSSRGVTSTDTDRGVGARREARRSHESKSSGEGELGGSVRVLGRMCIRLGSSPQREPKSFKPW